MNRALVRERRGVIVLLIEPDGNRRRQLAECLHEFGFRVTSVANVAEIERWPAGEMVLTDVSRFTPFWLSVGATAVVVMAATADQGVDACRRGATTWVPRVCDAELIASIVHAIRASQSGQVDLATTAPSLRPPLNATGAATGLRDQSPHLSNSTRNRR